MITFAIMNNPYMRCCKMIHTKSLSILLSIVLCICLICCTCSPVNAESSSLWQGKLWYAFGDSITSLGYYIDTVNEELGTVSVKYDHSGFSYSQLAEVYTEMISDTIPSIITLFAGTNDFGHSGSIEEMQIGLRTILDGLYTAYPTVQIVIITPLQRNFDHESKPIETGGLGPNEQGLYLIDYVRAIRSIAETYGTPCLDLYSCGGINLINAREKTMDGDGLHPSKSYGPVIGHIIARFINQFAPYDP